MVQACKCVGPYSNASLPRIIAPLTVASHATHLPKAWATTSASTALIGNLYDIHMIFSQSNCPSVTECSAHAALEFATHAAYTPVLADLPKSTARSDAKIREG